MSIALPRIDVLSVDALPMRLPEIGDEFARHLQAPYLSAPVAAFFCRAADISNLDAAALAIQDDETTGPTLAVYGIADFSGSAMSEETEDALVDALDDAFSTLDEAVFRGPQPIGTSFEYVNRFGASLDDITAGLKKGDLPSLCGIDIPPSSYLAILARE